MGFMRFLDLTVIVDLSSINKLTSVMQKCCVYFAVETASLLQMLLRLA
jgi:hypothetical protein